ncbi:hypothetical protein CGMCC3_g10640 [Colletotrichum fructicola]|nr:uncharacterized protein CGMCC3_g10640 [Colletotrichum fructicola]KAE9573345.1 hypothetical protein CGMCC3_g10640 [Colletotrichum fructicola]
MGASSYLMGLNYAPFLRTARPEDEYLPAGGRRRITERSMTMVECDSDSSPQTWAYTAAAHRHRAVWPPVPQLPTVRQI